MTDIELQRLKASEVVMKASRLARLVGHAELTEFLGFERNGYPNNWSVREWIERAGRWGDAEKTKFHTTSIAKLEAQAESHQQAIEAMQGGGNYSGDMALLASRNHDARILNLSVALSTSTGICRQVIATVYDMVSEIYHELLFSELQASLFADTQSKVDGSLAAASGSALDKIERVSDRLRDGDPESVSQALTTCRRLIDSCADYVFPPRDEPYSIGEVTLKVGPQQVLNRLQAHTHARGASKNRRDRLRRTLGDLYERCSAGTHAEVPIDEARFVFLQTYIALGEILTLRMSEGSES
ncbi:AbiTii domain-containing protein [Streptomyces sp. NPDC002454]|uniref:AbiTii domain-containing protein n=1 Tax=Streptomyces sp. NPDC002490 TaxID=3154416 RepID=UPI00332F641A